MSCTWRWQRFEDARRQTRARVPDLDCDERVAGAVVVAETARHALADDVVRLAGWKPGDVGVSVVVGKHGSRKVSAGSGLGIQPPDRDDADGGVVLAVRVVVDGLEGRAVSGHATDQPLRPSVVDLPVGMAVFDRLLDLWLVEAPFANAYLRVFGPDETLDLHDGSLWGADGGRWLGTNAQSGHCRPQTAAI